ncbi:MAG: 50S ribosomal protein L29 [Cyanobacteriota/Melainabacteria group bacterium]|mgnify:CR=1 FL=1|jgi:large subunit ribosomal protein L29|nr:50S ribosomal protein L29 [Cyanobacteria bacterium HKST-UBA01]MCB9467819.1 50S ribosomal protein L29 [Candidatus Obscuribacterales bacterium]HMP51494.1 50S ribosomal protein L29 [Candidatus Melainabacteria bacterium]
MKVKELRELTLEDLKSRISETRKELVDLRFQHAMRKLENTAKLKSTRRSLSRMLTVEAEMLDQAKEESSK